MLPWGSHDADIPKRLASLVYQIKSNAANISCLAISVLIAEVPGIFISPELISADLIFCITRGWVTHQVILVVLSTAPFVNCFQASWDMSIWPASHPTQRSATVIVTTLPFPPILWSALGSPWLPTFVATSLRPQYWCGQPEPIL